LFRAEYIFDLEKAVVVETPQLGHATYVFAKPRNMESFLRSAVPFPGQDDRAFVLDSQCHLRRFQEV